MTYITICDTKDCPHASVCQRKQIRTDDKQKGFEFTFEVNDGRFERLNERAIPDRWAEGQAGYEGEYHG